MRLRVLHVAGEYPPHRLGGTATFLENVVTQLSDSHDVAVAVVRGRDYQIDPPAPSAGQVRVEDLDLERAFAALSDVRLLDAATLRDICPRGGVLGERWDVVHVHDWYGVLPALALADHAEIVITPHLPLRYGFTYANHPIPTLEKARLEALGFRVARRALAPSRYIARLLEREYSVPPQKIRVVPNGVDLSAFTPEKGRLARVPTLLSVSRLAEQKGLDHLLRILTLVRKEHADARLLVAGDGPERAAFEAEVRRLGLEEAVELRGYVPHAELAKLYASAHVFVSTSVYEPFGLTTLEAMASGTPVVASPIGGASDFVRDGVDGFLKNPADVGEFARAVTSLLDDPERRRAAAESARSRATEHSWAATARDLTTQYAEVVSRPTATPAKQRRDVVLAWHVHQPFFVPDEEVSAWVAESYRPLLALHRERGISFCLNVSGGLLRRLSRLEPGFVEELTAAVRDGAVELMGSGMHHPMLPLLPEDRARAQIHGDLEAKRRVFGRSPAGFWPADLGFAHWLVEPLATEGVQWTIVDGSARLAAAALPAWETSVRDGQRVLAARPRPLAFEAELGRVARARLGDRSIDVLFRHHELSFELIDFENGVLNRPERIEELASRVDAYFETGAGLLVIGDDGERVNVRTLNAYGRILDELARRDVRFTTGSEAVARAEPADETYLPTSTFLVDFEAWETVPDDRVCFRLLDEVQRALAETTLLGRAVGDAEALASLKRMGEELLELEDSGFYFWKFVRRTREPFVQGLGKLKERIRSVQRSLEGRLG